jgi:type I restriction enzyme S subunit
MGMNKKPRATQVLSRDLERQLEAPSRRFRPYPNYKDSGVEWLGDIPAHWETRPLRRLLMSIEQGWSPIAEDREAKDDEWAVIKLSAIHAGTFRDREHKALPVSLESQSGLEIHQGDILLTRANTPNLVGDVCLVRSTRPRLLLCDLAYRLRVSGTSIAEPFLVYWLLSQTGRHQIKMDARFEPLHGEDIPRSHQGVGKCRAADL